MFNKIKKILLLLIVIGTFFGISNTYAEAGGTIEVKITTDFASILPGICLPKNDKGDYVCNVPKGISGFEIVVAGMIKYITFIASLAGVLFIVVNGIMYSMGGADDSLKTESKKRIMQTLIGLILLLMSGVILKIVAPWIYS